MAKDITEYLYDKNVQKIGADLADHISRFVYNRDSTKEKFGKVDYDYNISHCKMAETESNTQLSFDIDDHGILFNFFMAMYERDLNEEEEKMLSAFMQLVSEDVSNHYYQKARPSVDIYNPKGI